MTTDFPPADPHLPIEEVFPNVFLVRGTIKMGRGMRITRNMTVLRHEKTLCVVNSVRLNHSEQQRLESLGTIKHVFKLGAFHGIDDPFYVRTYGAKYWVPDRAELPSGLQADHLITEDAPLPIPNLKPFVFTHARKPECALIAPNEGGILLTCDSVQNWIDFSGCSWVGKVMMRIMGFLGPMKIGPMWLKYMENRDGPTLEEDFRRLLEHNFQHLLSAHGAPARGDAHEGLTATIRTLYG